MAHRQGARAAGTRTARIAAAAGLVACAALGGVRPFYGPVPGSVTVVLGAAPDAVTRAAVEEVQHAGLAVERLSAAEGYLETQWFDLATHGSSPRADPRDPGHAVKLRFFADPTADKTRLAAEVVATYLVDPSRPPRELEQMAPEGSPGRAILGRIMERLKGRFPVVKDTAGR